MLVANKGDWHQHCLEHTWIQGEEYQLEGDIVGIVNQ